MRFDDISEARDSFLATCAVPPLRFQPAGPLPKTLRAVWDALGKRNFPLASERALEALSASRNASPEVRAALYVAVSAAAFSAGNRKRAMAAAEESVLLVPQQWSAHRLMLQVFWADGDFENAYFYLSTLLEPGTEYTWDEPLATADRHVAIASLAWRLHDWDGVHDHLMRAFPAGVTAMPVPLREDAFRVAVYRDQADDAAEAARSLLTAYPVNEIDSMLRTIDARGWTDWALDLYRLAYSQHAGNQLLRRRLVGLCVRQGCVDEARTLTEGNALDLAA